MTKHFITFLDYTTTELTELLDLAAELRQSWHGASGGMPQHLTGKAVGFLWEAGGFRNRVSFELGISRMGGNAIHVPGELDAREPIEDVARYLDNWFNGIVARARVHEHMERLGAAASIPVINARTNFNHPCEILGDLAYIRLKRGSLDGLKVAFVGEATNLCHPWFEAAARLPIEAIQICPEGYQADPGFVAALQAEAVGSLGVTHDLVEGLGGADVIYTDCWPSAPDPIGEARIRAQFLPYQITAEILRKAGPDMFFLPCPPVTRGEEISADAMTEFGDQVFEAKEFLLHAQNAVLVTLL
jgi:ornithine carbamoyltransferase